MGSKQKILSICIPTFNRKDYLIRNLKTISNIEGAENIEIVIADDASTDGTRKAVKNLIRRNNNLDIVYKRFNKKQYFDKIVLKVVELARTQYCWLISDDDEPGKKSIKKIENVIKKNPGVSLIHLNYSRFDKRFNKITAKRMVGNIKKDRYFTNASSFFFKETPNSYFSFLGANVITMSTDVVNRRDWLKAAKKVKNYVGHNFIHCFVIATMIRENPKIYYLATPTVQYLANNHRIWPNDIWKDYHKEFLGYLKKLGYSSAKVRKMRQKHKKFEGREALMKNKFLGLFYRAIRPLYVRIQYLKTNYDRK